LINLKETFNDLVGHFYMSEMYLKNSLDQLKLKKTQSFNKEEKLSGISLGSHT